MISIRRKRSLFDRFSPLFHALVTVEISLRKPLSEALAWSTECLVMSRIIGFS
ncbi:hypothetical protein D5E79_20835 [Vibrio parahaemolyticus]|nr:hypothetical protein D5E79_20835 [Vibrio parahaemolyticus]TOZ91708.1 hypothetical protein DXE04_20140 [Vibrio parahaemolyticus]